MPMSKVPSSKTAKQKKDPKKTAKKAKDKKNTLVPGDKDVVSAYIENQPEERRQALTELRNTILKNLPKGFAETMGYGMPAYVIPHALYPGGYHCNPELPLPFMNFASQKNFIAFYHMGLYSNKKLYEWFTSEYAKRYTHKLDMGKSCLRFKKIEQIPFQLIGELVKKVSAGEWIDVYEKMLKNR